MPEGIFITPIQIEEPNARLYDVLTVEGMAEYLLHRFPETGRGWHYETALMSCLDALSEGDTEPDEAREAFVEAAHEVGLIVLPDDGPDF